MYNSPVFYENQMDYETSKFMEEARNYRLLKQVERTHARRRQYRHLMAALGSFLVRLGSNLSLWASDCLPREEAVEMAR